MDRGRYAGPVGWVDARGNGRVGHRAAVRRDRQRPGAAVRGRRHRQRLGPWGRAGRDPGQVPAHAVRARGLTLRAPGQQCCGSRGGAGRRSQWRSAAPSARLARTSTIRMPVVRQPFPASASARPGARSSVTAGMLSRGRGLAERPAVRGAEHPLEGRGERGLLQQGEDPAPSLLTTTSSRSGRGSSGLGEQAGRVVRERGSPSRAAAGPPRPAGGRGRPARGGDQAVDAARAPAGQHRDPRPRRHLLVEIADGEAGRPRAAPRRAGPAARSRASLGSLRASSASRMAAPAARAAASAASHDASHPLVAGSPGAPPAGPPRPRRWRSGPDPPSARAPARPPRAAGPRRRRERPSGRRAGARDSPGSR